MQATRPVIRPLYATLRRCDWKRAWRFVSCGSRIAQGDRLRYAPPVGSQRLLQGLYLLGRLRQALLLLLFTAPIWLHWF